MLLNIYLVGPDPTRVVLFAGRHGTQQNDIQYNDTQHNIKVIATLSTMTLNALCCHLCWVQFMLSVANMPIMPSVFMLSVVMLKVVEPFAAPHY